MARGLDDIPTVPEAAGDVVTTLTP
jgi:hypothetical protein